MKKIFQKWFPPFLMLVMALWGTAVGLMTGVVIFAVGSAFMYPAMLLLALEVVTPGPLCGIAGVDKVNAGSQACSGAASLPFTLTAQVVGLIALNVTPVEDIATVTTTPVVTTETKLPSPQQFHIASQVTIVTM